MKWLSLSKELQSGAIRSSFQSRLPGKYKTFEMATFTRRVLYPVLLSLSILYLSTIGLRLINKVAIIGSGTAGLGLAAALKQLQTGVTDITVFESRTDFLQSSIGGGVQLSGGAAVLEKIGCLPYLEQKAHRMKAVRSRNSFGTELLKLNVLTSVNDKARNELCSLGGRGQPMIFSIMRDALQHILYNATQTQYRQESRTWSTTSGSDESAAAKVESVVAVKGNKRCIGLVENESTGTVSLSFEDGTEESGFDMVFGADGVSSVLRQFTAFKDDTMLSPLIEPYYTNAQIKKGMSAADIKDKRYTGLRITYGITPVDNNFSLRPGGENTFHQWFGSGCYALTASYGGLKGIQHMLAVVYRDDRDSAQGENAAWSGDRNVGLVNTKQEILTRLSRAGLSSNKEIKRLLDSCDGDRFIDLGVRDNTIPLRGWSSSSGRVVLIGDSAHAM